MNSLQIVSDDNTFEKSASFVMAGEFTKLDSAKSSIVKQLSFQVRKHGIDYKGLCEIFERVRKDVDLRRPKRQRILPQLLSEDDLRRFFQEVQGNVQHEIMLKFLLYTSVRVNELVNIKVGDVDLGNCKVFINQGKGSKDRYILFPESFRLVLASHLSANPNNKHLFQSRHFKAYTPRRIQQIMREHGQRAGLGDRVHPHLFRHQMLTALTRSGLSDAQIQLISGHGSKKSLEIYQHLGLEAVEQAYQNAVKGVEQCLNGRTKAA
jgi:integrase/recombinase XerD